jgi:roadblock/LC7 domain-containing protein
MSTPPPPPPPPPGQSPSSSPVVVEFNRDLKVANWRPLVNWLLAIPHFIVLYGLNAIHSVLLFLSFFAVLFTKKNPFVGFQTMILRYQWRAITYAMFMRDEYPPFDFASDADRVASDPAVLTVAEPGEMNRWLPLIKWLLLIPHLIVLALLGIGVFVVWIIAFFAVLFTGAWPKGMRDFVVGVMRWDLRVTAYFYLMTDAYPPFSLE